MPDDTNSPIANSLLRQLSAYLKLRDSIEFYRDKPPTEWPKDLRVVPGIFPTYETLMKILDRTITGVEKDLSGFGYSPREIHNIVYATTKSRESNSSSK